MRITLQICDHCECVLHGGGDYESYRIGDGPVLDICAACLEKPFRKVEPSAKGKALLEVVSMALSSMVPSPPKRRPRARP